MTVLVRAARAWRWRVGLAALLLAGCASPPAPPATPPATQEALRPLPEGASGVTAKAGWSAQRFMVATANPLATEAGYRILRSGGSAVDAAVAVQMVLALVEPQSSGLGGGAFLMHWDGRQVQAWDGRETAPAAADERLFLRADGTELPFMQAVVGGRAVGVPGAVRMLEAVHAEHGKLPWAALFEPAIALAEQGFAISPRLHALLRANLALQRDAQAGPYFFGLDGQPRPVGHRLMNPALAQVLRAIAAGGSAALHRGPVAADIVARVRGHATHPGLLSEADLAAYRPRQRDPICTNWLKDYRVCGMPPPSSGHLVIMQILGLLERLPGVDAPPADGLPRDAWLHTYIEAARLAAADRALYVADPDFVTAPGGRWATLLDPAYLRQRAARIGPQRMPSAPPGIPGGATSAFGAQPEQAEFGTSHWSVVDAEGRAVAMTSTIEYAFGAQVMSDGGTGKAGGFLLNNQLTDFAFAPADAQGRPIANRVQAGKRPRSSMSPTLVFNRRDGRLLMSLGSAGGATIIDATAKTLIGTLNWGLSPQQAIALPNFGSYNNALVLERGRFPESTRAAMQALGHTVTEAELTSGLHAIQRTPGGWLAGADPRREGVAQGD